MVLFKYCKHLMEFFLIRFIFLFRFLFKRYGNAVTVETENNQKDCIYIIYK